MPRLARSPRDPSLQSGWKMLVGVVMATGRMDRWNPGPRRRARLIARLMAAAASGALAAALASHQASAQDISGAVGPLGVITTARQVLGGATISSTAGAAAMDVRTASGVLTFNASPSSPITVSVSQSNGNATGPALQASVGGTINLPTAGVTVNVQSGNAVMANGAGATVTISNGAAINISNHGAGLVALAGGVVNATDVAMIGSSASTTSGGWGAVATNGTINLGGASSIRLGGSGAGNTGPFALGIGAEGTGVVNVTSVFPVTLSGPNAVGVYLFNGGQVNLPSNFALTMNGVSANGMVVDNTTVAQPYGNLTINLNGVSTGSSQSSAGVVVIKGGSASFDHLVVTGSDSGAGVWAYNSSILPPSRPGTITLTGGSQITINSSAGSGYKVIQSPNLVAAAGPGLLNGGNGSTPVGGLVSYAGTINSTDTTITVNAANTNGVAAWDAGLASVPAIINLTRNAITTTGSGTTGLLAYDGAQISAANSSVKTSGGGQGVYMQTSPSTNAGMAPVSVSLNGTTVQATGPSTTGLVSANMSSIYTNTFQITGGSLTSEQDIAIYARGPLTVTASGATISGPDLAVTTGGYVQPTVLALSASNASALSGDAIAYAGTTINIGLATSSSWTGAANNVTNVTVDPTSRWTVTDSSTVAQTVDNAGLVEFTPPQGGVFKTLYTGNYIGRNGVVGLNTHLGADGSPSDVLVINGGGASGASALRITNAGGEGALTTGDGIRVVATVAGGITQPGMFTLAGPVVAGPYEYRLYRTGSAAADSNAWFLRSGIDCSKPSVLSAICGGSKPPIPPEPPTPPTPAPTEPLPNTPDPAPPTDQAPAPPPLTPEGAGNAITVPDYRPEVSLYTGLPALAALWGRASIDNLHDRVGEEEQLRGPPHSGDGEDFNGVWARLFGWWGHHDGGSLGVYGDDGPTFNYSLVGLQAGVDMLRKEDDKGRRDHAGLYLAFGQASGTIYHVTGQEAGTDEVDSVSLGGYWTHFWKNGSYLDAIVQHSWYDAEARSTRLPALKGSGTGWALSLEGARPFLMKGDWILEPQLQLTWQTFARSTANDIGGQVTFDDTDSLVGRLGLRAARTWTDHGDDKLQTTGWLRLNLFHEFLGAPKTTFQTDNGPIDFEANLGSYWAELNAGVTRQLSHLTTVYVTGGYQRNLEQDTYAWTGKLGVRFNW